MIKKRKAAMSLLIACSVAVSLLSGCASKTSKTEPDKTDPQTIGDTVKNEKKRKISYFLSLCRNTDP